MVVSQTSKFAHTIGDLHLQLAFVRRFFCTYKMHGIMPGNSLIPGLNAGCFSCLPRRLLHMRLNGTYKLVKGDVVAVARDHEHHGDSDNRFKNKVVKVRG